MNDISIIINVFNIIVTAGAVVIVAIITNKVATKADNKSSKEKQLEYQDHVHMILKEIGDRLAVLRQVNKEIDEFKNIAFYKPKLSSEEGFALVYHFYTLLRKIKPEGGFDHFHEFETLFAMENLNGILSYRASGEKIENLEKLENEIEKIKDKMDELNSIVQQIYTNMKDPYSFFTTINSVDDKEIVGRIYEKILNGANIHDLNDDMKLIEFKSSDSFTNLCLKFSTMLSECEKIIKNSKIIPNSVKNKYFNIAIYEGETTICPPC